MEDAFQSLTGRWIGRYDYGRGSGVAFEADLIDQDGQISGRTAESNSFRSDMGGTLVAQVQGERAGLMVQFVKDYLGFAQPSSPIYEGQANAALTRVDGLWRFPSGESGRFVMLREPRLSARRRRKASTTEPAGGSLRF